MWANCIREKDLQKGQIVQGGGGSSDIEIQELKMYFYDVTETRGVEMAAGDVKSDPRLRSQ